MMKKRKKLKRLVSFILTVCIVFSATSGACINANASGGAVPGVKPPSIWVSGGKSFGVNKVYSTGLLVCGTALVKIAGSTDCEEFQKVASFINKWVCGGGQGQTLGEIKALCTEILNEVKVIEKDLAAYTSQMEKMLGEDRCNELLRTLDEHWNSDVGNLENKNNIKTTLEKYQAYMSAAESYTSGKCSMNDVDSAKSELFNEFCNIYQSKNGNIVIEDNTYEKLREKLFGDTSVYYCIHDTINEMRANLLKDTDTYADIAAQFAYQALPFASDQHDYILTCINKQFTEIIMIEMMCQEYLAQFGDFLEDRYPDNKDKWNGYNNLIEQFGLLNQRVAETMESMLDGELNVYPLYHIKMKITEYPLAEDAIKVDLHNQNYKKEWQFSKNDYDQHNGYETVVTTKAAYVKENQPFERVFTLTNSGVKAFYIASGSEEAMRMRNFDCKKDIYGEADQHTPSCDFMNLTKGVYSDGVNKNYKCAWDNTNEYKDLFNTNAYLLCDNTPAKYLSQYYTYANGNKVCIVLGNYSISTKNLVKTGYEKFKSVIEADNHNLIDNFKTIEVSGEDLQSGKGRYNSYYSVILANNDKSYNQKTDVRVKGSGKAEIFIDSNGKKDSITTTPGSEINLKFKAGSEDTVLKSLTIQRYTNASDSSKLTDEVDILTKDEIRNLEVDDKGYYVLKYNTPYSNIVISLNAEKGHYVYCDSERKSNAIQLDSYSNIFLKDEMVSFFANENVENVTMNYGSTSKQINLTSSIETGIMGNFTMPDSDVMLNVSLKPCEHEYTENGFCTKCGMYQPAEYNSESKSYTIKNAGQLFWFASLVNDDTLLAEFDKKDEGANCTIKNDIDLEGREWKPINNYRGAFDGRNHTISNLKITKTSSRAGLFGSIAKATIKDLSVKGDIKLETSGNDIGGIIGNASGGKVSNVTSYVNISNKGAELKHIGGIVGAIESDTTNIEKCVYNGNIILSNSADCIGGVVGYTNIGGRISNCANLGMVSASRSDAFVGGILGYLNNTNATIVSCYNYGNVSNEGNKSKCGAIIGWARGFSTNNISDNYYRNGSSALVCGSDSKSGIAASFKNDEQFASGEVTSLLNKGVSDGKQAWYQTIGEDDIPVLDAKHKTVYRIKTQLCPGCEANTGYSNINQDVCGEHDFENGICIYCGLENPLDPFEKDEDGNYLIKTYDDLVKLSEGVLLEYDFYGNKNYKLANNIIAPKESVWKQGIGSVSENKPFNGTFNGNGYCIMGLNIDSSEYGGLFEIIGEKGKVQDLFVVNYSYITSSENAGSIASINNGTIDHCTNGINVGSAFIFTNPNTKEPMKAYEYNSEIKGILSGGIAARNAGLINGCRNAAVIKGTECGGIAGINTGKIYGCANNGTVGTANSSETKTAGGIAGKNGGTIESSYNSEMVNGKSGNTVGSIAGLNGFETENNPKVSNVFYINMNGLKAVGTDSIVKSVDSSNSIKKQSEMKDDSFTDLLNSVTNDTVKWCRGNSINKGYPKIETQIFKQMKKKLKNGIIIEGSMHSSLDISYDLLEEGVDEFDKLVSNINSASANEESDEEPELVSYGSSNVDINDDEKVLKGYSVSLTDSDKHPILAELWVQGDIKISVPVEHGNVSLAGVGSDGKLIECEPQSYDNGMAVFKMSEPISFVIVDKSGKTVSDDKTNINTNTHIPNDNSIVKTGDLSNIFLVLFTVSVSSAIFIIMWRRRKKVE